MKDKDVKGFYWLPQSKTYVTVVQDSNEKEGGFKASMVFHSRLTSFQKTIFLPQTSNPQNQ